MIIKYTRGDDGFLITLCPIGLHNTVGSWGCWLCPYFSGAFNDESSLMCNANRYITNILNDSEINGEITF